MMMMLMMMMTRNRQMKGVIKICAEPELLSQATMSFLLNSTKSGACFRCLLRCEIVLFVFVFLCSLSENICKYGQVECSFKVIHTFLHTLPNSSHPVTYSTWCKSGLRILLFTQDARSTSTSQKLLRPRL